MHGRVVRTESTQLLIAAKIEDVAIPGYDFLNHCGPRDFIHRLWQQLFLKTVQANAQILRGKLWRGPSPA
jgi:hypothetical protein